MPPPPPQKGKYAKSNARQWCEYCRIYVYNNSISKDKHDNGPQHKAALARHVDRLQREQQQQERLTKELEAKSGITLSSAKNETGIKASFYQTTNKRPAAPLVDQLSMKGSIRQVPKTAQLPGSIIGIAPSRKLMAQAAYVSGWTMANKDTCSEEEEEDTGTEAEKEEEMNIEKKELDAKEEICINNRTDIKKDHPINNDDNDDANDEKKLVDTFTIATPTVTPTIKIELRKFSKPNALRHHQQ